MVIAKEMTDLKDAISARGPTPNPAALRRDSKVRAYMNHRNVADIMKNVKNTKAEFKRLKTILPSVRYCQLIIIVKKNF